MSQAAERWDLSYTQNRELSWLAFDQRVLEDIRRKKLKVVPQCPFVATYIRRHPEWMDLVLTAENK